MNVIERSPCVGIRTRGEAVILSELYWVWLPGIVLMLVLMGWRVWGR